MEKRAFRLNGFLALLVLAADGYALWLLLAHPGWLSLSGPGQRWAVVGAAVIAVVLPGRRARMRGAQVTVTEKAEVVSGGQ